MSREIATVNELVDWIEQNIDKRLLIDDVAKKAGYTKWHLQRMFQRVTGQNIGSYIRKRKLERAAYELRETKKPIIEIAFNCGYKSQAEFTRVFSSYFGVPPAKWRHQEMMKII
ncbi:helix-turn-helix domain-containing protein [Pantoea stewartii]|uniref:helix-turn-helix domain-containing protein n=1 Tax=Pantoea stewartii TaxID=66269 RepID=UPI0019817343|nr:helix-turn-helix domain-containing protein [Pantoea stewartii]